jgi:iron complex outermembrane recepter protein
MLSLRIKMRSPVGRKCGRRRACKPRPNRAAHALLYVILGMTPLAAWSQQKPAVDLTEQPLEDLMNMRVTTVSKDEQKISQIAAAIFVITQEDIRNSGDITIPDLLRMVPGLDIAQIGSSVWAVASRGFNGRFSNKLLVMVDGRPVYTESSGGVFWDTVDLPLEDIDRIEVIRGPGGSVWGANAVNGIINIITKSAATTHGVMVVAGRLYALRPREFLAGEGAGS